MTAYDNLCEPTEQEYADYIEEVEPQPVMLSTDFEFSISDIPFTVKLNVLSPRSKEWHEYVLNDEYCSCPAFRPCYHRALLQSCGNYKNVLKGIIEDMKAQRS